MCTYTNIAALYLCMNYDKYFSKGNKERNTLTEFNSSNTELLNVEEIKAKLLTLQYIKDELAARENEKCKY